MIPNGEQRDSERSRGGGMAAAAAVAAVVAAAAAEAVADGNNLPGASAAVGGSSGDHNGRRGRTQMGKGREPAQRRRQARADTDGQGTRAVAEENNDGFT